MHHKCWLCVCLLSAQCSHSNLWHPAKPSKLYLILGTCHLYGLWHQFFINLGDEPNEKFYLIMGSLKQADVITSKPIKGKIKKLRRLLKLSQSSCYVPNSHCKGKLIFPNIPAFFKLVRTSIFLKKIYYLFLLFFL